MKKINYFILMLLVVAIFIIVGSCSKSDETPTQPVPDACATSTINLSVTTSPTQASNSCTSNGAINASATGNSTFEFKLDSGAFTANGNFTGVSAGSHTVTVKNTLGCVKTASINVGLKSDGSQFQTVKNLMDIKCASCHAGTASQGGFSFQNQCNIITKKDRIVERAVTIGDMPNGGPTLTAAEKKIITDWIAGGGTDIN
jgi:mono/diheme cytochrome c family protein